MNRFLQLWLKKDKDKQQQQYKRLVNCEVELVSTSRNCFDNPGFVLPSECQESHNSGDVKFDFSRLTANYKCSSEMKQNSKKSGKSSLCGEMCGRISSQNKPLKQKDESVLNKMQSPKSYFQVPQDKPCSKVKYSALSNPASTKLTVRSRSTTSICTNRTHSRQGFENNRKNAPYDFVDFTTDDLTWDAYIPPLQLRWSDVAIKQIIDLVEKDNEKYIQHIRKLSRKRDMRPVNIVQRLCWFDDDTDSLQTLVGVFEYDM